MNRIETELEELNSNDNESSENKIKIICDNTAYEKESVSHLPKLYYLVI